MSLARLLIPTPLMDDLLSALRRHHRDDSERLLQRWDDLPFYFPGCDDEDDHDALVGGDKDFELTTWVQREARLHVAGGRFEHALCLVEHNRPSIRDEEDHP